MLTRGKSPVHGGRTNEVCLICNHPIKEGSQDPDEKSSTLMEKGVKSLQLACERLGRNDVFPVVGGKVHTKCYKEFTDSRRKISQCTSSTDQTSKIRRTRSRSGGYISIRDCLFCGIAVDFSLKRLAPGEGQKVRTLEFASSVKADCDGRKDEWAHIVRGRIEFCKSDLHAYDCVYHRTCRSNFSSGKQLPIQYNTDSATPTKRARVGRPANELQQQAFERTCEYLVELQNGEQVTMPDLVLFMENLLLDSSVDRYSQWWLKQKLIDKYKDLIIISSAEGSPDVVTLRETADQILRSYYKQPRDDDVELQKNRIIEAAAKIIKDDIQTRVVSKMDEYPSFTELDHSKSLSYLPCTLKLFLSKLFPMTNTDIQLASIGQCIMQRVRPRSVIAPLQLGLAVQMHHHFRSRFLINSLCSMGFSSSYNEVVRFERNAATTAGPGLPTVPFGSTMIMSADNVDHNICTLDGKNTLHGMGMIASITPKFTVPHRLFRKQLASAQMNELSSIKVWDYRLSTETKQMLFSTSVGVLLDSMENDFDLLWKFSWTFKDYRPNWNGTMQAFHRTETHPDKATIIFLPIINLSPSDMSCILSTLMFLQAEARKQNLHPIITFDQPLFWKASKITNEYDALHDICLILGGFHTVMNLLGAVGSLMGGSGLRQLLEEIYAVNAVSHMLTGKAYSRALRGHLIVDTALFMLLYEKVFGCLSEEDSVFKDILQTVEGLYNDLMRVHRSVHLLYPTAWHKFLA